MGSIDKLEKAIEPSQMTAKPAQGEITREEQKTKLIQVKVYRPQSSSPQGNYKARKKGD